MDEDRYVHGYSEREAERLQDQAGALAEILHCDIRYPHGSKVLEVGCGIGAQTVVLAENSLETHFTSVDSSLASIEEASNLMEVRGIYNVEFQVADVFNLPFEPQSFDHVFVCFLLEHLKEPEKALRCMRDVLKPGGTITVIEGDHGSSFFYPDSRFARLAVQALIDAQAALGGDSLIGRRLHPLITEAGFTSINVSPRMVYVDSSRPDLVEGFTRNTFTAMVEGAREPALAMELITEEDFDRGVRDLYRTSEPDGTFCYTFFKAVAQK
ncbi:MAG: methyltransferase domain-containing protein [Actinobacteria bacterium]|nr:methyltransferase domain-containing protein [Actinomycetota bacterium]